MRHEKLFSPSKKKHFEKRMIETCKQKLKLLKGFQGIFKLLYDLNILLDDFLFHLSAFLL